MSEGRIPCPRCRGAMTARIMGRVGFWECGNCGYRTASNVVATNSKGERVVIVDEIIEAERECCRADEAGEPTI